MKGEDLSLVLVIGIIISYFILYAIISAASRSKLILEQSIQTNRLLKEIAKVNGVKNLDNISLTTLRKFKIEDLQKVLENHDMYNRQTLGGTISILENRKYQFSENEKNTFGLK